MKILKFDRHQARITGADVLAELKQFAADRGLTLNNAGGQFSPEGYTMRLEMKVADARSAEDLKREEFNRFCGLYGLVASDFGASFFYGGKRWVLTGINPSRPKYAFSARDCSTGKAMMLPRIASRDIIAARRPVSAAA